MFEKLGLENENDSCVAIGRALKSETRRLEEHHGKRLGKLEEQMNQTRVDLVETQGRIDNLKTVLAGEGRLYIEMLNSLDEKIERIERNTSKEQSVRRAWSIALVAALPGLVSVILRIIEMLAK